jgi:hypothetical protein
MKQLLPILILAALMAGCNDKEGTVMRENGIELSPAATWMEAYPGSIINFKLRVRSSDPVTSFGIRFKTPYSTDFVALPEYPDLTGDEANAFSNFKTFEYALPASKDTIRAPMQIRFVATCGNTFYQKDYTVTLVSAGRQVLRLYNPQLRSFFHFSALDIVNGKGVEATAAQMIPVTTDIDVPLTGKTFKAVVGWEGANSTTFKLITATHFNDSVHKYPSIYAAIAAASELKGVSSLLTANTAGMGALSANNAYYMMKTLQNGIEQYAALNIKKYPLVNAANIGSTTTLDTLNDYLQFEIKQ